MASGDEEVEVDTTERDDEETNSDAVLVSKRKAKAFVWKYFGFETDGNGRLLCVDLPKCRLCPNHTTVAAKDSNTSNLYSHLKTKHPEEYALACQASKKKSKSFSTEEAAAPKLTLLDSWDKRRPLSSLSREDKTLTNAVTYCLARDMLPLSTVDKPGFRKMLQQFNPRYQLPTRKHFTKVAVPALVNEVKSEIEEKIKIKQLDYYSATTDLWTSAAGDPYMTFTVHFIDANWDLKSYCLQTHYLPMDHTGTNFAEALEETIQQWDLEWRSW